MRKITKKLEATNSIMEQKEVTRRFFVLNNDQGLHEKLLFCVVSMFFFSLVIIHAACTVSLPETFSDDQVRVK
jgi:hypothetical protein